MSRPWGVNPENWDFCMEKFPKWLKERGGIVVYENHVMDSSSLGDKTFMPASVIAIRENGEEYLTDAPEEYRPHGGLPSLRQQKVDHIRLRDFDSMKDALACFEKEKE